MMTLKKLSASLMAASLLTLATPLTLTHAANHPLSMTSNTVDENGVEFVDLTVNVDWDFADPPTHFNATNITLNKQYIRDQIAQVARSVFVMTNGKQKLRNVYVFNKKQYGENVDVQLINKEGRAYASGFSGFGYEGFSTYNFLGMNTAAANEPANVVNENFLGQVVAHELGHYFLGLADEYVEDGKALDPANPGSPAGTDTPLNTLMNNHETFARLSTAADYGVSTQTAQGRVYRLNSNNQGASAWETLIRNPALDSDVAKGDAGHNGRRIWFAAFKNLSVPAVDNLRSNSGANSEDITGYDSDTRIIFKDGAAQEVWSTTGNNPVTNSQPRQRKVIVIDRTLPESAFNEAIATAKAILAREAAVTDVNKQARYGVVALPATSGLPPILSENTDGINDRIAGLSSITRASSGSFDVSVAFNFVRQNLLPTPDAQSATTDSLELLTRQGATAPADLGAQAKANKVALNIVGFRLPASMPAAAPAANTVPLATLAQQTGGDFNTAKNAQEATREMAKAAAAQAGEVLNLIDADSHPALGAGSLAVTTFFLSPAQYDGEKVVLKWYFDPADASKLVFRLRGKSGGFVALTTQNGLVIDADNGMATYTLTNETDASTPVEYVMRAEATAAMVDGIDMEVYSDASTATNPISLGASVVGGATDSLTAPVITARFGGRTPIKGGEVTVSIVRASDGTTVLEGLSMQDNGAGADERANDGVYTLSLDGRLPAGDYAAVIVASTTPGTSSFSSNVIRANGGLPTRADEIIEDEIQRLADVEFTLLEGAKGVVAAAAPAAAQESSGGGGGCTALPGQTDASLLALVLGAAGFAAWRRRKQG